jgi:peptidoglycan/LPS O-acetylase OafA/YrhL
MLRLAPLYFVAMAGMFALVGQLTAWSLQVPLAQAVEQIGHWLVFSMWDQPDINGLRHTSILIAHVTWSLSYEWMYYLSLPVIAVLLRRPVPWVLTATCLAALAVLIQTVPNLFFPTAFLSGSAVALLTHWPRFVRATHWRGWQWVLALVLAAVLLAPTSSSKPVMAALLTIAFCLVACGEQDLFGVLSSRAAQILGEVSYSIYLLHGLALASVFLLVMSHGTAAQLSPLAHWSVVMCVTVLLMPLSVVTYRRIELPFIRWGQARQR